jgi:hypothetical protein
MNPPEQPAAAPPVATGRTAMAIGSMAAISVASYLLASWAGHDLLHFVSGWTRSDLRLLALGAVLTLTLPFALAGLARMWPGDRRPRFHPVADRVAVAMLAALWPIWSTSPVDESHPPTEFAPEFLNLTERLALAEVVMVTFGSLSLLLLLTPMLMRPGWLLYGAFVASLVGSVWLTNLYVSLGL